LFARFKLANFCGICEGVMDFENKFDYGIEADFGGLLDGDKWSEVLEAMQRGLEKVKECGLIK